MSRNSQARLRYRISRERRRRAIATEAHDCIILDGPPVKDRDGVWRQVVLEPDMEPDMDDSDPDKE